MRASRAAPVSLHSIAFAYPGAPFAILLRDHRDDRLVPVPEWPRPGRPSPVAYVRRAWPTVQVVLARRRRSTRAGSVPSQCLVSATGVGGPGVAAREVALRFGPDGLTAPLEFRLSRPLPPRSGRLHVIWAWRLCIVSQRFSLGTSSHDIWLTARPILSPAASLGRRRAARIGADAFGASWAYARVLQWACEWTAGIHDEKATADALLENLPRSKLKYAVPSPPGDIRWMLKNRGGFCGCWSRLFEALAASQGVAVPSRGFMVDWRVLAQGHLWCAMVVRNAGVGRARPTYLPRTWHDAEWPPHRRTVRDRTERRYYFHGLPDKLVDGHGVNVLEYRGSRYLYDPSYLRGPIRLDRPLPAPAPDLPVDVADLGNFHARYLSDPATGLSMLGVLSDVPEAGPPGAAVGHELPSDVFDDGLTISAAKLDTHRGTLTFHWV